MSGLPGDAFLNSVFFEIVNWLRELAANQNQGEVCLLVGSWRLL